MKNKLKIFTLLLVSVLLITAFIPTAAFAQGKIEPDTPVVLTVSYKDGEKPIVGASFRVLKVADVDEYARMKLTPEFAPYKETISGLSRLEDLKQEEWLDLAATLKSYAAKDKLPEAASAFTDEAGQISFELETGLYLLVGYMATTPDYYTYSAVPYLIFLPARNSAANTWSYSVETAPKFAKDYNPSDDPSDKLITRKALKIWDDEGYETIRPEAVSVQLLCDGEIYDEAVLCEANSWRFFWDNLDAAHEWEVTEATPEDYTVSIHREGITFAVTNKYIVPVSDNNPVVTKKLSGDKPPKAEPFTFVLKANEAGNPMPEGSAGGTKEITISGAGSLGFGEITFAKPGTYVYTVSEKAGSTAGYTYDKTVYTVTYQVELENGELSLSHSIKNADGKEVSMAEFTNNYKGSGVLPQTGLLWWPVPVLILTGIVLIMIGVIRRRSSR